MTLVAVTGVGGVTTTAAALAIAWPGPCLLVESDPSGGDVGAWWDLPAVPSLSSAVAAVPRGEVELLEHVRRVAERLAVLAAPVRAREAAAASTAAVHRVLPILAATEAFDAVLDAGSSASAERQLRQADVVVVVARQVQGHSSAAAAVVERLAEAVHDVMRLSRPTVVALIGEVPYPAAEVGRYLGVPVCTVAEDPVGAQALMRRPEAGRSRLIRSTRPLVSDVQARLPQPAVASR